MEIKKLSILIIAGLVLGCNADRRNFENVSETLVKAAINNDTIAIKDFFIHNMDSIDVNRRQEIFSELRPLKGKNYNFLKSDTISSSSFFDSSVTWKYIDSYFRIDSNYYSLTTEFVRDKEGEILITSFSIQDLSQECIKWTTQPYCPKYSIEFKRIIWNTDYWNKTFKSGKVELHNKLKNDIDFVKFRVILKNNWTTFFNQTVTYNGKIFAGDINTVEVPGMSDLFTGFDIKRDNLQFNGELIEVLPKPESTICRKLNELKSLK